MNVDSRFEAIKVLLADERKEFEENQARECQTFEKELGRKLNEFRERVASDWEEKEREMTKQRDDFVSEELGKFARVWEPQETYETLLSHGNPQTNATWQSETQREVLRQRSELKKMEDCCKEVKNKLATLQASLDKQGSDIKDLAALKVSEAQRLARVPEYPPRSQSRLHKPSPLNFTPINTFPSYNPYTSEQQGPLPPQPQYQSTPLVAPIPPQETRAPSPASSSMLSYGSNDNPTRHTPTTQDLVNAASRGREIITQEQEKSIEKVALWTMALTQTAPPVYNTAPPQQPPTSQPGPPRSRHSHRQSPYPQPPVQPQPTAPQTQQGPAPSHRGSGGGGSSVSRSSHRSRRSRQTNRAPRFSGPKPAKPEKWSGEKKDADKFIDKLKLFFWDQHNAQASEENKIRYGGQRVENGIHR
ncbi:hypothetical protein BDN72DRAFT_906862 [Pluteus cervinus]|uniref:Uncharacterized protein n=1 Tax=Pluteus cervinus TaxID=181527 RepID=A0ACD2ZXQ0_9AGAR|nr:hypothetical protein BDN72DRAFT_906862 [Pluteus cervinus]